MREERCDEKGYSAAAHAVVSEIEEYLVMKREKERIRSMEKEKTRCQHTHTRTYVHGLNRKDVQSSPIEIFFRKTATIFLPANVCASLPSRIYSTYKN